MPEKPITPPSTSWWINADRKAFTDTIHSKRWEHDRWPKKTGET